MKPFASNLTWTQETILCELKYNALTFCSRMLHPVCNSFHNSRVLIFRCIWFLLHSMPTWCPILPVNDDGGLVYLTPWSIFSHNLSSWLNEGAWFDTALLFGTVSSSNASWCSTLSSCWMLLVNLPLGNAKFSLSFSISSSIGFAAESPKKFCDASDQWSSWHWLYSTSPARGSRSIMRYVNSFLILGTVRSLSI